MWPKFWPGGRRTGKVRRSPGPIPVSTWRPCAATYPRRSATCAGPARRLRAARLEGDGLSFGLPRGSRPACRAIIRSGRPARSEARGSPCLTVESRSPLEGNDGPRCGPDLGCGHFQRRSTGGVVLADPSAMARVWKAGGPRRSSRCRGTSLPLGTSPASRRSQVALVSPDSQTCGALCRRATRPYRPRRGPGCPGDEGGQRPAGCRRLGGVGKSSVALEHAHRRLASGLSSWLGGSRPGTAAPCSHVWPPTTAR